MNPSNTDSIFDVLPVDSPINVLDIGAALLGGKEPEYVGLIDSGHGRLFAFEPDEAALVELRQRFPAPHVCLPYFVADGNSAIFHETSWFATGSLFEPNTPLLERFNFLPELTGLVARHPVQTVRLDDIDAVRDIDFIKIDAQGAEQMIFENARRVLDETTVIQTEVSWVELYKGMPLFGDIDRVLRSMGFQWHFRVWSGGRAFLPLLDRHSSQRTFKQELWGDVVYVRDWMHFDSVSPHKLIKLAVVLHELYGSHDLAHRALADADKQAGTDHATRYAHWLADAAPSRSDGDRASPRAAIGKSSAKQSPPFLEVANDRGILFSVPASIKCISTYVLLEQTRWFEKEIEFIYRFAKPGMVALDVGANIGVYTLPLAQLIGPTGRVIAYEPSKDTREHLLRSLLLNRCENVEVSPCALSDYVGNGLLQLNDSSELHQMVSAQTESTHTEAIEVSTLDVEAREHDWARLDFVKLDAEGQEEAILNGAPLFFERYSPLVMFEVKHGRNFNIGLADAFRARGFDIYRLLGDSSMLVPVTGGEAIDSYELNFFAARPSTAALLAERGLLVAARVAPSLTEEERELAIAAYCSSSIAMVLEAGPADIRQCPFGEALIAHSAYRFEASIPAARKLALLERAFEIMRGYCESNASLAALITLARIAADFGARQVALHALDRLLVNKATEIDQPFLLPSDRIVGFDLPPIEWFSYAAREAGELHSAYSTLFGRDMARLNMLADAKCASPAIIRRRILAGLADGETLDQMQGLLDRLRRMAVPGPAGWHEALEKLAATL